jgi:hypothetical protein
MACKVVQRSADFHLICFNGYQKGLVASCVMKICVAVLEIGEHGLLLDAQNDWKKFE